MHAAGVGTRPRSEAHHAIFLAAVNGAGVRFYQDSGAAEKAHRDLMITTAHQEISARAIEFLAMVGGFAVQLIQTSQRTDVERVEVDFVREMPRGLAEGIEPGANRLIGSSVDEIEIKDAEPSRPHAVERRCDLSRILRASEEASLLQHKALHTDAGPSYAKFD